MTKIVNIQNEDVNIVNEVVNFLNKFVNFGERICKNMWRKFHLEGMKL